MMNPTDAYRKELRKKELKRVSISFFFSFSMIQSSFRSRFFCVCLYACFLLLLLMGFVTCLFYTPCTSQNKKERKKVREVGILKKDPESIKEQIDKLETMSKSHSFILASLPLRLHLFSSRNLSQHISNFQNLQIYDIYCK